MTMSRPRQIIVLIICGHTTVHTEERNTIIYMKFMYIPYHKECTKVNYPMLTSNPVKYVAYTGTKGGNG